MWYRKCINLKILFTSLALIPEETCKKEKKKCMHALYDYFYITFLKRQNCRNREQIGSYQFKERMGVGMK